MVVAGGQLKAVSSGIGFANKPKQPISHQSHERPELDAAKVQQLNEESGDRKLEPSGLENYEERIEEYIDYAGMQNHPYRNA